MMNNNKKAEVTVTKQKNTIVVNATIPSLNPRKGVEPIRFDLTDARNAATAEYGDRVGSLSGPSVVLENRPRTNNLSGTWVFNYETPVPTTASNTTTTTRTTRSTRRNRRTKTQTTSE